MAIMIRGFGPTPGGNSGFMQYGPFPAGTKLISLKGSIGYSASPSYAGFVIGISDDRLASEASMLGGCRRFLTDGSEPAITIGPATVLPHAGTAISGFQVDIPLQVTLDASGFVNVYVESQAMLSNVSGFLALESIGPTDQIQLVAPFETDVASINKHLGESVKPGNPHPVARTGASFVAPINNRG